MSTETHYQKPDFAAYEDDEAIIRSFTPDQRRHWELVQSLRAEDIQNLVERARAKRAAALGDS